MPSILLLSGGFDSAILAYQLGQDGVNYRAVHFNFGQPSSEQELLAASRVAAFLDRDLDVIDIRSSRTAYYSSFFAGGSSSGNPGRHVLQLGTMLMLGPILPYANRYGFDTVYLAYVKSDADASPEWTQSFLDGVSNLTNLASAPPIKFKAPFVNKEKSELLTKVSQDTTLLELTWSCILGEDMHCGICRSCRSRKAAFTNFKSSDPTKYKYNASATALAP